MGSTTPQSQETSQEIPTKEQQQQHPSDAFTSSPGDPWHLTFNELKVMRARMGTLEKVEAATLNFAQQLQAITSRTGDLEAKLSRNSKDIKTSANKISRNSEKKIGIKTAYRLGRPPAEGNTYARPILIKFYNLADRNAVWRMRNNIPQQEGQQEGQQKVKIQADIPKKLRDGIASMYRIVSAASGMEEFKSATIKDYAISLNGKQYTVDQLETLPPPIRPSSLAVRESDETLIFFSKSAFLSNHSPSTFMIDGHVFNNMEHFLAFKKAELSQQEHLIQRALQASDPAEA